MSNYSTRIIVAAVITLLFLSAIAFAQSRPERQPDQDVDVIRVSTTLVTVPVSVLDRNGRFIADLKQEQFHLFEDGVEQQISFFENAEQPFTIGLMLDTSDSTVDKLAQIKSAAAAFIDQLRDNDRVIVMAFDQNLNVLCDATSDRSVIASAIDRVRTGGGTSLYDAVHYMSTKWLKRIRGRKAIVLFTDGVDTTSRTGTYDSTLRAAEELDALIYTIRYDTYKYVAGAQTSSSSTVDPAQGSTQVVTSRGERLDVAYKRGENYLNFLSDKTAGRFYNAASLDYLKQIFAGIADELRHQYSLGYYPSNKSATKGKRELKVKVSVPNVALRYRRSYIYTAPAP